MFVTFVHLNRGCLFCFFILLEVICRNLLDFLEAILFSCYWLLCTLEYITRCFTASIDLMCYGK